MHGEKAVRGCRVRSPQPCAVQGPCSACPRTLGAGGGLGRSSKLKEEEGPHSPPDAISMLLQKGKPRLRVSLLSKPRPLHLAHISCTALDQTGLILDNASDKYLKREEAERGEGGG